MNRVSKLACIILTLLISACGFQLRGNVALPAGVEPIYIGGLNNNQLSIELRNLLSASGIKLTSNPAQAQYSLLILAQNSDRRAATLGEGARVAEYQLIETASFKLLKANGQTVLGPNQLSERKIMPNDPNKVASTAEEENLLRREMLQRLAEKIARQLQSFDYQNQPPDPA
jgi:LPS-assembly lipoprotein